jgi:hypothetical protein
MPPTVVERLGSRQFDAGTGGGSGQLLFTVLGAASEDEAVTLALAEPIVTDEINGYLRDSWSVTDLDGANYNVDVKYKRGVPAAAAPTAGQSPSGSRPSPPGQNKDDPLTRDVSFSMGGATQRIFRSHKTRLKIAKPGDTAPDFGGLIGIKKEGDKYTAEGCEVVSATSDFTVTKRYQQLTIGWFRHVLDLVATTNSKPFLGTDVGESLLLGVDGQFKDGDKVPWTATAKWKYSRNREAGEVDEFGVDPMVIGELTVEDLGGHEYLWVMYDRKEETVTVNGTAMKVIVEYPKWAYVEVVYLAKDHNTLGFN